MKREESVSQEESVGKTANSGQEENIGYQAGTGPEENPGDDERYTQGEYHKYDDIIDLPHHVSLRHPRMSPLDRAAQFSPFAALTGHGAAIRETARLAELRMEKGDREAD